MWNIKLQMSDYSSTGDSAFQHPGEPSVKTNVARVPREEDLYRKEKIRSSEKLMI